MVISWSTGIVPFSVFLFAGLNQLANFWRGFIFKTMRAISTGLEKDPNDKAFFQMIKRNQSNETNNTPEILVDGETFAEYFKNLATPQDSQHFKDELLSNSTNRCNLMFLFTGLDQLANFWRDFIFKTI
jgi:hypothetical protein